MPLDKPVKHPYPDVINQLVALVAALLAVDVLLRLRQALH